MNRKFKKRIWKSIKILQYIQLINAKNKFLVKEYSKLINEARGCQIFVFAHYDILSMKENKINEE